MAGVIGRVEPSRLAEPAFRLSDLVSFARGPHTVPREKKRSGPTRMEAAWPITVRHGSSRHPITARHVLVATPHPVGQPSPPPTAGLLACIACTSCLFLPHLLFLYSHSLHALTTRLVAVSFSFVFSIFHVLVEVSLQNCEKQ